jgi:hypothetical protein
MKHKILTNKLRDTFLVLALLVLVAGTVTEVAGQTKKTRPAPAAPVKQPAGTVSHGSGVGGGTGSGVGGTTGTGTGTVNGSGIGTPSGSSTAVPNGNAAGQPTGNGAGTITGIGIGTGSGKGTGASSGEGTGAATGNAIGANTGSSTGAATGIPVVGTRTYIKELNGRCYYVTPQGEKHYVNRRNCALFPK